MARLLAVGWVAYALSIVGISARGEEPADRANPTDFQIKQGVTRPIVVVDPAAAENDAKVHGHR